LEKGIRRAAQEFAAGVLGRSIINSDALRAAERERAVEWVDALSDACEAI